MVLVDVLRELFDDDLPFRQYFFSNAGIGDGGEMRKIRWGAE